jgi:hypothetical protein
MRRVPAILIALFLACPFFFAALTTVSLSTWVLDRSFYISLVNDERLYQIPDLPDSDAWWSIEVTGFTSLQGKSLLRAAREVIPASWMRGQAVRIVGQVFDVLEGRASASQISLDLTSVKTALLGEPGKRFARALAEDLPVGGAAGDFTVRAGRLPSSRPSSITVDRAAAIIQAGLPGFVKAIPDTETLADNGWVWVGIPRFSAIAALVIADVVLLLIAAGFTLAAAFAGGATLFERLQWAGWSLFAPAAAVFLVGLGCMLALASGGLDWGFTVARLSTRGFGPPFISALTDLARHVTSRVGTGFLATGAIAAGAAISLLAWSSSIPKPERKGAEA